jgi:hypothetical protein
VILNRRAGDGAERTEYAAVARFGLQQRLAMRAFVEKLAGIGRHLLFFGKTAYRTGDRTISDDVHDVVN